MHIIIKRTNSIAPRLSGNHNNSVLARLWYKLVAFVLKRGVKLQPTNQPTSVLAYQLPIR